MPYDDEDEDPLWKKTTKTLFPFGGEERDTISSFSSYVTSL